MDSLRVVLAHESAICRAELKHTLERAADIRVPAEARDAEQTLHELEAHRPDLLIVGLEPPGPGLTVIERVMSHRPLPILVVISPGERRQAAVFESIRRGALDLAAKPTPGDVEAEERLRRMVRELSRAHASQPAVKPRQRLRIVGIGASVGGPNALVSLLGELPTDFPLCVAVVQHFAPGFVATFAEFLSARLRLPVRVSSACDPVLPGVVYLARDDHHLVALDSERLGTQSGPPVDGHRPSADTLLESLAGVFGSSAVGVVLSGIGRDGSAGLTALKAAGGVTLAQDRKSSSAFGMPRAAFEAGAARYCLEPRAIGRFLVQSSELRSSSGSAGGT